MAALDTVSVQHEHAKAPKQVRISRNVRRAIDLMVHEGQKRAEAAQSVGITDDAMRKAFHKPEVLAYRNEQMRVIRTSAASRVFSVAENLMDNAESEHVRVEAMKWIGGTDGISPVQRSESTIEHRGLGPGLQIIFAGSEQQRVITNQPSQPKKLCLDSNLREAVPFHWARNDPEDAAMVEISGDSDAPDSSTGGEK